MLDVEALSVFQVLPVSQAFEPTPFVVKPSITVISQNEFLILSWTGASTLGVFVTGDGDPVRGTLEWPSHPEAICKFLYCLVYLRNTLNVIFRPRLSIHHISPPEQHHRNPQRRHTGYRAGCRRT